MRIEVTRTFPVPLKTGWDYLQKWAEIPNWREGVIEIFNPETAWSKPGDGQRFAYRLLGRRVEGTSTLEEFREGELERFTVRMSGLPAFLPAFHEEWHYAAAGEGAFTLKVVQETEPATSFLGKAIGEMLAPKVAERDLRRSLDNLQDVFASGVAE